MVQRVASLFGDELGRFISPPSLMVVERMTAVMSFVDTASEAVEKCDIEVVSDNSGNVHAFGLFKLK